MSLQLYASILQFQFHVLIAYDMGCSFAENHRNFRSTDAQGFDSSTAKIKGISFHVKRFTLQQKIV